MSEQLEFGLDLLKETAEKNEQELSLDNLTDEQRGIISKHFDYLLYLGYLKDKVSNSEKLKVEEYMCSELVVIAATIEMFEKRNELVKLGLLK